MTREELFKEVEKRLLMCREADFLTDDTINDLVSFILADRLRVVEPLVKVDIREYALLLTARKQTLSNAGVQP